MSTPQQLVPYIGHSFVGNTLWRFDAFDLAGQLYYEPVEESRKIWPDGLIDRQYTRVRFTGVDE